MWLQQDIEIWKKIKMQKCENFGSLPLLARNLSDQGHIMSITDKSSLLYRYNMWLTNKILRYRRIVQFKRQNAKISARSLRSLVIIYEISQVSDLFFWPMPYHEYYEQKNIIIPT